MSSPRQQLSQREIDAVLRHYDIGRVRSISELPAGSIYSPKVVIESDRGKLLLKRRARGLDLPALVAFSHEVLLGCQNADVCVPPLLGTNPGPEQGGNSMVQFEDHVYELFVYIDGEPYARSPEQARQAGALLRETHKAMDELTTRFEPAVEPHPIDTERLCALDTRKGVLPARLVEDLTRLVNYGKELAQANASRQALVHGDWHPGNMIFRGDDIVAICDFDNTRLGSRPREIAQGLMNISLIAPKPGESAAEVPPEPELDPLRALWRGYARGGRPPVPAKLCLGLLPAVMVDEALASLPPVPSTHGAPDPGMSLLTAVWRKAVWIDEHQTDLLRLLES